MNEKGNTSYPRPQYPCYTIQLGWSADRAAEVGGKRLAWKLQHLDSGPPRLVHGAQFPNFCLKFPTLSLTGYDLRLAT